MKGWMHPVGPQMELDDAREQISRLTAALAECRADAGEQAERLFLEAAEARAALAEAKEEARTWEETAGAERNEWARTKQTLDESLAALANMTRQRDALAADVARLESHIAREQIDESETGSPAFERWRCRARAAEAALARADGERDAARAVLRGIEWCVPTRISLSYDGSCPVCHRIKPVGHDTNCALAAALAGGEVNRG